MLLEAADAGRYQQPAPAPLQTGFNIKRWGALPEAGGLLDQPAGLLARIAVLMDYYTANKAYYEALMRLDNSGVVQWERSNPDAADIVRRSVSLRKKLRGSGNAL